MSPRLRFFLVLLLATSALGCAHNPLVAANPPLSAPVAQTGPVVYQVGQLPDPAPVVQTGRYSFVNVAAQPAQVDPLLAVIDVHLPVEVATVEDAVNYLLRRSGFNLLPAPSSDEAVGFLLGQPLPEVHRHLGPITLREALLTLGGKAFTVNVDYVYRKIGYQVSPAYFTGQRS